MTRARDVANVLSTATALATDTETAAAISSHATVNNGHLPSQSGNNGKFLVTDGSIASWANTPILSGVSTTSQTIGTGSKTWTVSSNLNLVVGQYIRISEDANPLRYMAGPITSYSGTSLVVNIQETAGSGGFGNSTISLSGVKGQAGPLQFPTSSISSNQTLAVGTRYLVDTTAARSLTMPASATTGQEVQVFDAYGSAATNNITILPNSLKVNGSVQNTIISTNGGYAMFFYTGSTYGWRLISG